ncbi:hypothetical protein CO046_04670 [Candidatus Peregrinibacteria bacterium CG_4_9_14_0_2_um_filter_53_11]|nr:MAG: hypothetical protein CO046_04670 [Candidatus Peregrinibacteria bacterium CG_4_9_14_0_2_um_filter_53_11]
MKKAIYKVPNGKLLKIFLRVDGAKSISQIKITGDFFMYPEETIIPLEEALIGTPLSEEALSNRLRTFWESHPTTLFGIDTDSLILTILNAAQSP